MPPVSPAARRPLASPAARDPLGIRGTSPAPACFVRARATRRPRPARCRLLAHHAGEAHVPTVRVRRLDERPRVHLTAHRREHGHSGNRAPARRIRARRPLGRNLRRPRTFRARQRFRQHLLQPRAYRRALARTHLFRQRIATCQHARAQLFFRLHRPQYSIDVTAPLHDNGGGVGS